MPHFLFEPLVDGVEPPTRATAKSRGRDLRAALRGRQTTIYRPDNSRFQTAPDTSHSLILMPGERALIGLGFKLAMADRWWAELVTRSSYALKLDLVVNNAPGIIEPDYPDEWFALLRNNSEIPVTITDGERVAQVLFKPTDDGDDPIVFVHGTVGQTTDRVGGLGSTGRGVPCR